MPFVHEDVEQLDLSAGINMTKHRWWTFCSCGVAFGGATSEQAYAHWEQHEADES